MLLLLFYLPLVIFIVGYTLALTEAFRQSMTWGLLVLLPPMALVYSIWHIRQQWLPTILMAVPLAFIFGVFPLFVNS